MGKFIVSKKTSKNAPQPIPNPPAGVDGSDFFEAMASILGEGTGQIGEAENQFVRVADLTDPEFIKWLNSQEVSVTNWEPAVQTGGISTDRIPEPPRNLSVLSNSDSDRLGAFCNHLIWDNPNNDVDSISGVEIWVAETNNRSDAVFTGLVTYPGNEYQHASLDPSTTYYYWIRSVNWAGLYSEWEPTSDQGGLVVKGSETVGETAQKIVNALKGEDPGTYSAVTEYDIGDQVKYTCSDGGVRSFECIKDEEDVVTDGKLENTSLGSELITTQVNRDFSGASNWTNEDINSYDESGDLSITADDIDQYCYLDSGDDAAMTAGKLYKLTFTVSNLNKQWRITDDNDSFIIAQEVESGSNTFYFVYTGTGGGGFRIISNNTTSQADFDDFSLKEVTFTSWTKDVYWNINLDPRYSSPRHADSSPLLEEAHCSGDQASTADFSQTGASFSNGSDYVARFKLKNVTAGSIVAKINGTSGTSRTANGTYQETITAGSSGGLVFTASSDFVGTIYDIQIFPDSGGSGITGHDPEFYTPYLWKRIGVLVTGDVDGDATVGVDGNLVVDGTITAKSMVVDELSAVTANLGTVTAGVAKSADDKFKIDFNERWLKVYDESGQLRVQIGFIDE